LPVASGQLPVKTKNRETDCRLFDLFVWRVFAATAAEFLEFQPVGCRLSVLRGGVVPLFALATL
jgi:hypothetical protein